MSRAHATLAPSSASRWFNCAGSIRMTIDAPPRESRYADEGSAAHQVAAACLSEGFDAVECLGEIIEVRKGVEFEVTQDMVEAVQIFLDQVRHYEGLGYEISVETKLDLGHLWPDQFGTGDALAYQATTQDLHVFDFKYGVGIPVFAAENPQLLSYGSGAAKRYHNKGVQHVTLHIVQPRVVGREPIDSWTTTPQRLAEFEKEFRQKAALTAIPDAPLKAGPWCQFCPAAGFCPAFRDRALALAQAEFDVFDQLTHLPKVDQLNQDQLGKILSEIAVVEAWCEAAREHAYHRAIEGQIPTGFKLVNKRAVRKWLDEPKAAAALNTIYDLTADEIYTRKIVSPSQAEKLIGKRDAKALTTLISKISSGVTLAPLSDKREAVAVDASLEFTQVAQEGT